MSSIERPPITKLALLAGVTLFIMPTLGLLMLGVGQGVGLLAAQMDPSCNAVLNPQCVSATTAAFFYMAEMGLFALFSPVIAWPGLLVMTFVASFLLQFRLAGYLPFVGSGAVTGVFVAHLMLTDWDINELGGTTTFAIMGGSYALIFRLLITFSNSRKGGKS